MEDLELGDIIAESLGIEVSDNSAIEEKLEEERLGEGSIITSLGASILLISIVLLIIVFILLIAIFICRRVGNRVKWHERAK